MINKSTIITIAIIWAIGFTIGLDLLGHYYYLRGQSGSITVTGSAARQIKSDVALLNVSFSVSSGVNDLKQSTDVAGKNLRTVLQYIKSNGIQDPEITVQPLSVNPMYNHIKQSGAGDTVESDVISGYALSQTISLESHNLDAVSQVATGASSLVSQGIILSNSPVQYLYSKLPDLKKEMLAEATKNAKERAASIAQNADSRLGQLKSAGQGVIQITAPNSTDLSDYGSYDTSSVQKQITAIVHASFGVGK